MSIRLLFVSFLSNGEFFVVNWVVDLRGCELSRIKGNRMKDPIVIRLRENGTDGKVRGISFDRKWFGQIWV